LGAVLACPALAAQPTDPAAEAPAQAVGAEVPELPELPDLNFSLPPLERYGEIIERPLFMPNRKPQKPDEQPQMEANGPVNPLQARLLGTIITPQKRQALIEDMLAGKILHLEQGMPIQDWQVKEIQPDRVVLARQGQSQPQELLLRTYNEPQAVAPGSDVMGGPVSNVPKAVRSSPVPRPATPMTPAQRRILERRYERRYDRRQRAR
jgi:hypothetical protein